MNAWVTRPAALAMGLPRVKISRWVMRGTVRAKGERQDRRYLLRDLAAAMAQEARDRGARRRQIGGKS